MNNDLLGLPPRLMTQVIVIAHAPLASALAEVGRHAYPDHASRISAVDVVADESTTGLEARLRALTSGFDQVLLLIDTFGATPGNVAARLADSSQCRLVFGVNLPMLWRVLNHLEQPLGNLADVAVQGAVQGVLQLSSSTRPQQQVNHGAPHDSNVSDDQQ